MNKTIYIFPNADFKFEAWSKALPEKTIVASSGPYWKFIVLIWMSLFKYANVIVFYRYLNNSKGLLHELVKLFIDFSIFFLSVLSFIEIRWIVHNIDKETYNRFSCMARLRRGILRVISKSFFVTSESLKDKLSINQSKVFAISFGEEYNSDQKNSGSQELNSIIDSWKSTFDHPIKYIGILTNWSHKESSALGIMEMLSNQGREGNICVVYVGEKIKLKSPYVLHINRKIEYFLKEVNVDFVVKGLNDLSIPYTMYSAATAHIPLITSNDSFFKSDLIKFKIGGPVESTLDIVAIVNSFVSDDADAFLKTNSWQHGAETLTRLNC